MIQSQTNKSLCTILVSRIPGVHSVQIFIYKQIFDKPVLLK